MKVAIVISQFNKKVSDRLLKGALKALAEKKFPREKIFIMEVPGAFEIPYAVQKLVDTKKYSGFIALGCVLKGETDHYKAVCEGVTYGIEKVSIENRVPVMFGVLMCDDLGQAFSRSSENPRCNKGYECAEGLVKLCNL